MRPVIAVAHLERGSPEEAWECARRAVEIAGMGNNVIGVARSRVVRGRVYYRRGSNEDATRSFSEAADVFRTFGQRHDLLRALLEWAELPEADQARAEADDLMGGKALGRPSS